MHRHGPTLLHVLLACLVIASSGTLIAAEREIRPGDIDPSSVVQKVPGMPDRGITKERVRARLGDPNREVPAVGEPPISRWVYDEFTVYFEHDRVLHSVKRRER